LDIPVGSLDIWFPAMAASSFLRSDRRRRYAAVLTVLAVAFWLRVVGQVLVAFWQVEFLPPMEQWYSGLLPYPLLLPAQILILAIQAWICTDFWRGRGYFVEPRRSAACLIGWLSYLYIAANGARYVITMTLHPDRRWFDGTIPIWFHFVLAAFLLTYSRFHAHAPCPQWRICPQGDF